MEQHSLLYRRMVGVVRYHAGIIQGAPFLENERSAGELQPVHEGSS